MEDHKAEGNGKVVDMGKLIRSVQRLEGNPDCFGKSLGNCDRSDCAWWEYCLTFSLQPDPD
jgi:hypothetical protein